MIKGQYRRLKAFPFETAFGGLAFFAGLTGLLELGTSTDALNVFLPHWLAFGLNCSYLISGLALLVGLGLPRRDIEGFGLVQLLAAVIVRGTFVFLVAKINPDVLGVYALYLLVAWACVIRLRSLFIAKTVAADGT